MYAGAADVLVGSRVCSQAVGICKVVRSVEREVRVSSELSVVDR